MQFEIINIKIEVKSIIKKNTKKTTAKKQPQQKHAKTCKNKIK